MKIPCRICTLSAVILLSVGAGCDVQQVPVSTERGLQNAVLTEAQVNQAIAVIADVEEVAEIYCVEMLPGQDCDFVTYVAGYDDNTVNAYQVRGEPTIIFTRPLLAEFQNRHEIAFVYGHEAAHYILRHGAKRAARETIGGLILGGLAYSQTSGAQNSGQVAMEWAGIGSQVGGRIYSPEEELEADRLGAELAMQAGYDPAVGVLLFARFTDGTSFEVLPTHPPHHQRITAVQTHVDTLDAAFSDPDTQY
ncbi:MAG: M48 family metalloprotease [Rhodobacteraceae bacterium]|nr:M48 family metalloprotease [Paracoccaceae bacterium]